ncbi:MAG: class I SAM-dependent methyltransferase [Thermoplasmata archaeon]|nr:class I SAM-dependent methyltransferase [Thermoplasmata archaeon]
MAKYPNVYDAAFSWDRSQEALTYLKVATARIGREPRSVVELACGSGPIARYCADRGLTVYGVDRSTAALGRARELSTGLVPSGHWRPGDLASFRLPQRVDLAVVPMDGLGYLVEEGDLLAFFRAAHRGLAPGGVLAIDQTLHPEVGPPLPIRNRWNVSLRPRGALTVDWRNWGKPWGSPPRRWEEARITLRLPAHQRQMFWEAQPHAILRAGQLQDLARRAGGFREMEVYSDAAHRARRATLQRLPSLDGAQGARLVCWTRR